MVKKAFGIFKLIFKFKWIYPLLFFIPILFKSHKRNSNMKSYIKKREKTSKVQKEESLEQKVKRYNKRVKRW